MAKNNSFKRFKNMMTALAMGAASLITPTAVSSGKKDENGPPLPEATKDTFEEDMKNMMQQAHEDVALSFRRDEEMVYKAYGITHKGSVKIKYSKDENGNVVASLPEMTLEEIKPLTDEERKRVEYLQGGEQIHFSRDPNAAPINVDFDGVKFHNGEVTNNIVVKKEEE